jgi:hypothetical protein
LMPPFRRMTYPAARRSPQAKRATRAVEVTSLRRPPGDEAIHSVEVPVNSVAAPAGLALEPDAADTMQVLTECRRGKWDGLRLGPPM